MTELRSDDPLYEVEHHSPDDLPVPHAWKAFVVFDLDDVDVTKFLTAPEGPVMGFVGAPADDPDRATLFASMVNQRLSHVVCYRCELGLSSDTIETACPGDPVGHDQKRNLEPVYDGGAFGEPLTWERWQKRHAKKMRDRERAAE